MSDLGKAGTFKISKVGDGIILGGNGTKDSIDKRIKSPFWTEKRSGIRSIIDYLCFIYYIINYLNIIKLDWLWNTKMRTKYNYFMTFVLLVFSVLIFMGEVTLFLKNI